MEEIGTSLAGEMENIELNINLDKYGEYHITLDSKEYTIDKEKIKEMLKPVLPTTFEEVESKYIQDRDLIDIHHEYSNELEILSKLLYLRDIYRNGWEPDWSDNNSKYGISVQYNQLVKDVSFCINNTFSFQSKELRDKFLENFKDMLEEIKELI